MLGPGTGLGMAAWSPPVMPGASGGVYLVGGILPRLHEQLDWAQFRDRFTAKGRYRGYLEAVPTWLITRENPALLGLQALLLTISENHFG